MTVEHRAGAGLNDIELADYDKGPALRMRQVQTAEVEPQPETPERRILHALAEAEMPLSQRQIRQRAATRPATVAETLQKLVRQRRVEHAPERGYRIAKKPAGPTPSGSSRQQNPVTPARYRLQPLESRARFCGTLAAPTSVVPRSIV